MKVWSGNYTAACVGVASSLPEMEKLYDWLNQKSPPHDAKQLRMLHGALLVA